MADEKIRQGWQVWLFCSKKDHPVGEDIRQRLIPGQPIEGSLNTNGGVVLQGVSIGLEGRY